MTTDLTRGSPLKRIFFFAIPFLLGNLFQQFYNVVDMVIVGRTVGTLAYAAVGSTGSLVWFASGAIQSLTVGFSVVTAHPACSSASSTASSAPGLTPVSSTAPPAAPAAHR